jgi:hypothetical protein
MGKLSKKERKAMEKERDAEDADSSEVPMNLEDMPGDTMIAAVVDVKITREYRLGSDRKKVPGSDKIPHVALYLQTETMDDDKSFEVKWGVSNSKKGTHAIFLQHLEEVIFYDTDGNEIEGQVGLSVADVTDLEGELFLWERKTLEWGEGSDGKKMTKTIWLPVGYYPPEDEEGEEEESEEEGEEEGEDEGEESDEEEDEDEEEEEEEELEEKPKKKKGWGKKKK